MIERRDKRIGVEPVLEAARGLARIENLVTSGDLVTITYCPADLAPSVGG